LYREGVQLKTATGLITDNYGTVGGGSEKNGMRLTGKKHSNPESPERQPSFLLLTVYRFSKRVYILNSNS
jgi:hypothetical protein